MFNQILVVLAALFAVSCGLKCETRTKINSCTASSDAFQAACDQLTENQPDAGKATCPTGITKCFSGEIRASVAGQLEYSLALAGCPGSDPPDDDKDCYDDASEYLGSGVVQGGAIESMKICFCSGDLCNNALTSVASMSLLLTALLSAFHVLL